MRPCVHDGGGVAVGRAPAFVFALAAPPPPLSAARRAEGLPRLRLPVQNAMQAESVHPPSWYEGRATTAGASCPLCLVKMRG